MKCKCGHEQRDHYKAGKELFCLGIPDNGCPCPAFTPEEPVKLPEEKPAIKLPVRYDDERATVYDADDKLLLNNLFTPNLVTVYQGLREYEDWKAERDRFGQAVADALNADVRQALEAERDRYKRGLERIKAHCYHRKEESRSMIRHTLETIANEVEEALTHEGGE